MSQPTRPQHIVRSPRLLTLTTLTLACGPLVITSEASSSDPVPQVRLNGVVRDFRSDHADFAVGSPPDSGHYAGNLGPSLDANGRPIFVGGGRHVFEQFYDKDGYPIMPYADRGLAGGHFDVDVFDAPVVDELYHKHQFDDRYDTATIDIMGRSELLFSDICAGYPNPLRIEVLNPHNSGLGLYVFEAGAGVETGRIADGISGTFLADDLTQFAVTFQALSEMRGTKPGDSQSDPVDRDDAFAIRLYDTVTDELVYEISAYEHLGKHDNGDGWDYYTPTAEVGEDACGVPFDDTPGTFAAPGTGAVSSSDSFDHWFRYVPGVNLEKPHAVTLTRDQSGVYEYATDSFFPIDGDLYGNEGEAHNNFFTYSITTTATYSACSGQFLDVESNDDTWVYINGQLVIDLGGVQTPANQRVALDRLGLADGEEFTVYILYAQRRQSANSIFRLRTNIEFPPREVTTVSMALWD